MKIPRDLSGLELAKALKTLGYEKIRQDGSHIRLTTQKDGQHHVTVPNHSPVRLGTLRSILKLVAEHHHLTLETLVETLDF